MPRSSAWRARSLRGAGKYADLIVVKGNPLKDLRVFQNGENLHLIMKAARRTSLTL